MNKWKTKDKWVITDTKEYVEAWKYFQARYE